MARRSFFKHIATQLHKEFSQRASSSTSMVSELTASTELIFSNPLLRVAMNALLSIREGSGIVEAKEVYVRVLKSSIVISSSSS